MRRQFVRNANVAVYSGSTASQPLAESPVSGMVLEAYESQPAAMPEPAQGIILDWLIPEDDTDVQIGALAVDGYSYGAQIVWGDGTPSQNVLAPNSVNLSHRFNTAGVYSTWITGDFPRIYMKDVLASRKAPLYRVRGSFPVRGAFSDVFYGCTGLVEVSADIDLTGLTEGLRTFYGCSSLVTVGGAWTITSLKRLSEMFRACALETFPAGFFDSLPAFVDSNFFINPFYGNPMGAQGCENIAVSLVDSGVVQTGTFYHQVHLVNVEPVTQGITDAIAVLKSRGHQVVYNGVTQ